MKKLKAGIIGLGVGEQHIDGYRRHPGCEITALCDFDDGKLASAMVKYPAMKIVKEADQILEDPEIDIVSIASYDNCHYEQIARAIKNKKHVFTEKPLCLYEKEAVHIRKLLDKNPSLHLSSNLILRMSPRFRLLKQMIDKGEIGEIYCVEGDYNYGRITKITEGWRGKIDFYSVVYGGGVHIVDLLLWLTGRDITEVAAYGNNIVTKNSDFKYNDMAISIVKFNNGIVGKISANFGCVSPHFHGLLVYGTKATFINGNDSGILYTSRDKDGVRFINAAYPWVQKGDLIYSFVDSIIKGIKAEVSKDDVFKAMSVCFSIQKAMDEKHPVKVNYI